jgi:phage gp45-like
MATNSIKSKGPASGYTDNRGGATLITTPVIGIVKNNVDPAKSGRIWVYIARFGGSDPNNSSSWTPVKYMSPFAGLATPGGNSKKGADKSGDGKFLGNPQSYGFWASSPDIGSEVMCIFANGRIDQGYYIGCIPKTGLNQMTPAMGASAKVVPNDTEATSYGGADRLPTTEVNTANPNVEKSGEIVSQAKPVHSYQTSILNQQGLLRDNIRGVISSSAQRESPSRVFGISTPGGPIFEGGYTSTTISKAVKSADPSKLKMIGRTGGHSLVMDDGTLNGADQLIRLRTSAGHQITMSDTGQTLFIIHSNGDSWIEMGREGTIDIYATNSFNVRTCGDINFHADNNINLNAKKNINISATNIKTEASADYTQRVGGSFSGYTVGTFTYKVDGAMAMSCGGEGSYAAGGSLFLNGAKINLNTGSSGTTPAAVDAIQKTKHIDTTFSKNVGWMNPAPQPLESITTRAPAHQPWIGSGKGIDIKVDQTAPAPGSETTPATNAANEAAPAAPANPTTSAEIAVTPPASSTPNLPSETATALAAQAASSAQGLTAQAQAAAGVLNPTTGITALQAEASGLIPAGIGKQATDLMAKGLPKELALSGSIPDPTKLIGDVGKQTASIQNLFAKSADGLKNANILTGKESPAQAGGLVMAATTFGLKATSDMMSKGTDAIKGMIGGDVTKLGVVGSLGDNFAAGKLAGGLADGKSGLDGLKTSLSGMADSAAKSVTGMADKLKSGMQEAFDKVESSFTALKGGVTNILGDKNGDATKPPSALALANSSLESAKAAANEAANTLLEAKSAYRVDPTPENKTKLDEAEKAAATAEQKVAQSTSSLVKTGTDAVSGALKTASGLGLKLPTTLTSGLNALPGGAGALMSVVNKAKSSDGTPSLSNPMSAITAMADKAGGDLKAAIGDPTKLAGDLTGKMADALKKSIPNPAAMLASLETGMSTITNGAKAAIATVGSVDKAAVLAKTSKLLGDPKIPAPSFPDEPTEPEDADEFAKAQTDALMAVEEAQAKVDAAGEELAVAFAAFSAGTGEESTVHEKHEALKTAQDELDTAEVKYQATLA